MLSHIHATCCSDGGQEHDVTVGEQGMKQQGSAQSPRTKDDGPVEGRNSPGLRLQAYVITLRSPRRVEAQFRRRLRGQLHSTRVVAVAGVAADEALSVAGVSLAEMPQLFGAQAGEPEFLPALGCTLGHLRAIERAMKDRASPALILEDDAVFDLQPFWLHPSLEWFIQALPSRWGVVQLSLVASQQEWDALRAGWRTQRAAAQLKRDFFWGSAAYLIHPRSMRKLLKRHRLRWGTDDDVIRNASAPRGWAVMRAGSRWELGLKRVRCIKFDTCVLFPALPSREMYVSVPPLFTCAERSASSIYGHDEGYQREVRPFRHHLSNHPEADGDASASSLTLGAPPLFTLSRLAATLTD